MQTAQPPLKRIALAEMGRVHGFASPKVGGTPQVTYGSAEHEFGHRLDLVIVSVKNAEAADRFWLNSGPAAIPRNPNVTHSRFGLGAKHRVSYNGSHTSVEAVDGILIVKASITTQLEASTLPSSLAMAEGVARRTFAATQGLTAKARSATHINGTVVDAVRGRLGETLVDVTAYCRALGVRLERNVALGTGSFKWKSSTVSFALGSKSLRVGNKWFDSVDAGVIKDGKWFVPFHALERARVQGLEGNARVGEVSATVSISTTR